MTQTYAPLEFRAEGDVGIIEGVAIRYNEPSLIFGSFYEQFEPGAFSPIGEIWFNKQHDRTSSLAKYPGGGMTVVDSDTELRVRVELPPTESGRDVRTLVERGVLCGLSIEYSPVLENVDEATMTHTVTRGVLGAVAVVDKPAHESSIVTLRRFFEHRAGGWSGGGGWDYGATLRCECSGPDCKSARFEKGSFSDLSPVLGLNAKDTAAAVRDGKMREVVASYGDYKTPVASLGTGSLRFREVGGNLRWDLDLSDSDDAKRLIAANKAAGIVGRPYLDRDLSEGEKVGDVMVYKKAVMRALILSSTDAREGWDLADFGDREAVQVGQRKRAIYGIV